jgi:hypothetical protein
VLPAELAVLARMLGAREHGAWLNSRGTKTGVIDLLHTAPGRYKTQRIGLPAFVSERLVSLYRLADVKRGAPDLVLWRARKHALRFVEVKCPHWDAPSVDQLRFMRAACKQGIPTQVCEWEFADAPGR